MKFYVGGLVWEIILKEEFRFAAIEPEDLKFPHKIVQPDDIIKTVKHQIDLLPPVSNTEILDMGVSSRLSDPNALHPGKGSDPKALHPGTGNDPDALHPGTGTNTDEDPTMVDRSSEDNNVQQPFQKPFESQAEMAERVVQADGVRFVSDLKTYMVQGVKGKTYSVTLHPKEICNCPSTATCYHILAAKMYICMSVKSEKEERKLVRLMRYKSRSQKKMGQKKPKTSDFEVIPAPDSQKAMEMQLDSFPVRSLIATYGCSLSVQKSEKQSGSSKTKMSSCMSEQSNQIGSKAKLTLGTVQLIQKVRNENDLVLKNWILILLQEIKNV